MLPRPVCVPGKEVLQWVPGLLIPFLPPKKPNTPFFPGTFVQNRPARSKSLATWTTSCPGPCSLPGDVRVARLGTPWCQGKAVAVSQESASPYCCPTIAPLTLTETQSTAKPGEGRVVNSSGKSPCKITFLVISKRSQKAFI